MTKRDSGKPFVLGEDRRPTRPAKPLVDLTKGGAAPRKTLTLGGIREDAAAVSPVAAPLAETPAETPAETGNTETAPPVKIARYVAEHPVMMPPEEVYTTCRELHINGVTLGRLFVTEERTARRWYMASLQAPPAVCSYLRLLLLVAHNAPYHELSAAFRKEADLLDDWQVKKRIARKERKAIAKLEAKRA